MMALGETGDVGRRLGMFMSIFSLGALAGPPISGAINKASGGFAAVGYYAGMVSFSFPFNVADACISGSVVLVGVALMCLTRHLVLRRIVGKF
jgi:MCP family monocarboxylic acid transporter-like MFS transporter 10